MSAYDRFLNRVVSDLVDSKAQLTKELVIELAYKPELYLSEDYKILIQAIYEENKDEMSKIITNQIISGELVEFILFKNLSDTNELSHYFKDICLRFINRNINELNDNSNGIKLTIEKTK